MTYAPNKRRSVTLTNLDLVVFFTMLGLTVAEAMKMPWWLLIAGVILACINFMMFRFPPFNDHEMPRDTRIINLCGCVLFLFVGMLVVKFTTIFAFASGTLLWLHPAAHPWFDRTMTEVWAAAKVILIWLYTLAILGIVIAILTAVTWRWLLWIVHFPPERVHSIDAAVAMIWVFIFDLALSHEPGNPEKV